MSSSKDKIEGAQPRLKAWLLNTSRYHKRAALVIMDFTVLSLALWAAFSLRLGELYWPTEPAILALMIACPIICIATLWWFDVYRVVTRYMGYRGVTRITAAVGLGILVWALVIVMSGQPGIPRSVIFAFGVSSALLLNFFRLSIKVLLESADIRPARWRISTPKKATIIYGAGQLGIRLLTDVRRAGDRQVVGFVDASPSLWRQYIDGVKIHAPQRLARLVERYEVSEVLVALSGSQRRERRDLLKELESFPVSVKILPAYEDVASGDVGVNNLRDVEVGDLLGRDPVKANQKLLARNIAGKSVLITGAGGSIGSELTRQVADQSPRLIVLFDVSEPALYKITIELERQVAKYPEKERPEIKAVLGSVLDQKLVTDVIVNNAVETIYHAAAYKHVPLVEHNPVVGLENNVFGTRTVAEAARTCGVERFVLISTDKAVRPANVMGASKRLAELVLQAEAMERSGTVFTVVRFGNVLDSSGSVVPLFRDQIRVGGPITVTHPEVTRYFMSIPEAAELVIQAGAMASGGEVFVLQMGNPVRIDDLARLMVRLSNLEVRDAENPIGDIEIRYVGLRPGEKLYEELLIGANTQETDHQLIFKADEPALTMNELNKHLALLKAAMAKRDDAAIFDVLTQTVEGYHTQSKPLAPYPSGQASAEWGEQKTPRTLH
ncbi:MAG TPA: nucleoside-diphosphate sugar epimerase/dehydratase [Hyphomicrobium sp.]|uniref:polysaccharide biosynthesis protein n=1 Tax=Hyphomicrobium sp. TaxID=82 RepID=UPI002D181716|nr:nucleoside-diphosphate sugar epimerase/dehydratase [Hyphomicrobium sp.]HRN87723.1 nucleoside-diphosphate sugar epimerase/dehydratase [Hyphomicrobium sp.]